MRGASFREIVIAAAAVVLSPCGFRKRGSVFWRKLDGLVHLVSVQSSVSSTASVSMVTVNIAIVCESLLDEGERTSVSGAHWRERLGHLMPQANDVWWTITTADEAHAAGAEIASALANCGLPALDRIRTPASLLALWQSGRSPGLTKVQVERYAAQLGGGAA
jgi:hypothetical protein